MSQIEELQNLSSGIRAGIAVRERLQTQVESLHQQALECYDSAAKLESAKQLLSVVSDETLDATVTYITTVINKVLNDMFEGTGNEYQIKLHKEMYRDRYTHINLELMEDGFQRDFKISSGMGIRQVISFLYTICLIEESGARKFLVLDEVLSNLNYDAAEAVGAIIKIFVDNGFQMLMIDHGNYDEESVLDPYIQRVRIQKIDKVSQVVDSDGVPVEYEVEEDLDEPVAD